jgi:hypothetical protein
MAMTDDQFFTPAATIEQYLALAELAQAAYGTFSIGKIDDTSLLTGNAVKMTQGQAESFAGEWTVVHHLPNTASGFSGALFQNKAGEYAFALCGTEGIIDWNTDIGDLLLYGIALDQIVDMYNYRQSLINTGVYQAAQLAALTAETEAFKAGSVSEAALREMDYIIDKPTSSVKQIVTVASTELNDVSLQTGLCLISDTTVVSTSGHSLGGYLAMAFSRLFPDVTSNAVAVNGAGFNLNDSNADALFAALGGADRFDINKITHFSRSFGVFPHTTGQGIE